MAGASLLTLLDDIATLLDDVAVMTKVAATKTAGVLGDDLALNAQQVSGVRADRELPVVWAVAKGSLKNKALLVPAALLISAFIPWLITPMLMLGGLFLCFEGFEKVFEKLFHHSNEGSQQRLEALVKEDVDIAAFEKQRVSGAIRTDFVLSAEIIVIALGVVQAASLPTQLGVLSAIALLITAGVYGLVAAIVKIDDLGFYLVKVSQLGSLKQRCGAFLVASAPYLMRGLTIVGTVAMFLVGGGIILHGIPGSHALLEHSVAWVASWPTIGGVAAVVAPPVLSGLLGVVCGGVVLLAVTAAKALKGGAE
ncbi:hypothetical protein EDC56_3651 [Sinobacterium caligoides]|uniref:DUF808 domain-containing protein n=1 Tax=Sinobacterium caligoides TaxID=933926 RepID=A0A3N2DE27_9GAMM|nr:DUF808 domain-containing protein [Sinobacterium caligoides]ROR97982.1 hypothetical protein EDC56_3651 [Sinobacterium caligoides]